MWTQGRALSFLLFIVNCVLLVLYNCTMYNKLVHACMCASLGGEESVVIYLQHTTDFSVIFLKEISLVV